MVINLDEVKPLVEELKEKLKDYDSLERARIINYLLVGDVDAQYILTLINVLRK